MLDSILNSFPDYDALNGIYILSVAPVLIVAPFSKRLQSYPNLIVAIGILSIIVSVSFCAYNTLISSTAEYMKLNFAISTPAVLYSLAFLIASLILRKLSIKISQPS